MDAPTFLLGSIVMLIIAIVVDRLLGMPLAGPFPRDRTLEWLLLSARAVREGDSVRLTIKERAVHVRMRPNGWSRPVVEIRVDASWTAETSSGLAKILAPLAVMRVRVVSGSVVVETPSMARSLGVEAEGERIVRIAQRIVAAAPRLEVLVAEAPGSIRCPYCHDEIAYAAECILCPECRSSHHTECYEEHGACAIFGCRPLRRSA
jgi:hypothetical protein